MQDCWGGAGHVEHAMYLGCDLKEDYMQAYRRLVSIGIQGDGGNHLPCSVFLYQRLKVQQVTFIVNLMGNK